MSAEALLVLTAHPGDFVWRAAGAIALAVSRQQRVVIGCMSFGERGESALVAQGLHPRRGQGPPRAEADEAAASWAPRSASSTPATTR